MACPDCSAIGPRFDVVRPAFLYAGAITDLILALKYRKAFELAVPFGKALAAEGWMAGFGAADLVVPVPLTPKRHIERGYNQAALIGKEVASLLGLPFSARVLKRVRWSEPMGHKSRRARVKEVEGAFEVARPDLVLGRRVILVDDVVTTGATASECARVLKACGATWVGVLSVARAVPGLT